MAEASASHGRQDFRGPRASVYIVPGPLASSPEQSTEQRQTARIAGWLFIATFVTAIAGLLLYDPVLNDADYIVGAGDDARLSFGALLEVFLIVTNIGTAIVLFPILKRQSESLALGFVASRIVEGVAIAIGIIAVMSIVTLREDFAGAAGDDAASLLVTGEALVAVKDWSFVMGPGFCVAVGNGLVLGYLMYRSGLVPRGMAMLGLIGGPLIFVASTIVLFGGFEAGDPGHFLMSIPEIAWELSLGIYLIVKGFRPAPVLASPSSA
jgi:hypothetical protein